MINNKVTIILGAGASYPYGFPLGGELKDKIVDQIITSRQTIYGRDTLVKILSQFGFSEEVQNDFALQLKESMQPSVDAFLFERPEYIEIGKLSIAANLIVCEKKENLMSNTSDNDASKNKWYGYFLSLLGTKNEFKANNLSIITFNYDRSFEYFLYYSLKPRFNLSDQEVREYIESIPIVHVYGKLGNPHFMDNKGRDYSKLLDYGNLKKGSEGIRLIYEKNNEEINSENLKAAHNIIETSDLIVFLGFGYLEENIRRLKLDKYYSYMRIFGTFLGMKPGEIVRAKRLIEKYSAIPSSSNIEEFNLDAYDFLRHTDLIK